VKGASASGDAKVKERRKAAMRRETSAGGDAKGSVGRQRHEE
jgi:hypothetical protein